MKNTPPWGPTPTPTPAATTEEALDPARRRLLRLLVGRRAPSSATVNDLVAAVGGHPNTTRHHLRALVTAALVEVQRTPPAGARGRPATRYAATTAGRDAAAPSKRSAADEYVALAAAFAERLAERGGDPGADARAIGKAWGAGLVANGDSNEIAGDDDISSGQRVITLLDRLGFSPDHGPASDTIVLLRTCPLLDAARRHPDVVCEVHLGLVAGALETLDEPSEGLHLEPFAQPGACVLRMPVSLR